MPDSNFMEFALKEAGYCKDDVPVGAVIVKDGEIIAKAHNQKEKLNDVTAHAEIVALKKAAKVLNNWRLDGCVMYVTLEPCPMCATAIINSRLDAVYFGAYDNLYGAMGSVIDLRNIFNSKLTVYGGIEEFKCSNLLKNFWRKNE